MHWAKQYQLLRLLRKKQFKLHLTYCCCSVNTQLVSAETCPSPHKTKHKPVLLKEVLHLLNPQSGNTYIDMTFGAGGHTKAVLDMESDVKIYALDRDPFAYSLAQELSNKRSQVVPVLGKFSEAEDLLTPYVRPNSVDGILFDLGASSMQFDTKHRGFSVSMNGPLDMRMDGDRFPEQITAADVVNHLDVNGLSQILRKYGEEKHAKKIAAAIVDSRYAFGKILYTQQLADIVKAVNQGKKTVDKISRPAHSATKTFQALRIFVNNELNELHNGLETAYRLLKPGGICVVISFHSLEDRIVKRHFHGINLEAKQNRTMDDLNYSADTVSLEDIEDILTKRWTPISKKIAVPSDSETENNPRARSAKLRAAIKQQF